MNSYIVKEMNSNVLTMDLNLNNIFHYILILDEDTDDHYFLRSAINRVVPQALIESVYDEKESNAYLNSCKISPNIIFLNLNMSNTANHKTLKLLRTIDLFKKVPVLVCDTAQKYPEKSEALKLGATGIYPKPNNIEDLISLIVEVRNKYLAS